MSSTDHRDPPVVITAGLTWCIAAGVHVLEHMQLPVEIIPAESDHIVAERLQADPSSAVIYVCGAASPRHFQGLERLRGEHPHAHLIAASPEPDLDVAQYVRALGLLGYMHFDAGRDDTMEVIRRVRAGERAYLPTERPPAPPAPQLDDPELERRARRLTRRERQVMELLGKGYANRDIAETLGLREGTIRIYVHRVIRQLGMRNRVDVALCASRMNDPA
ncbi:response regulator transcription factor [Rhodovibrio salinarum]|uniref:response regulator transcription factor n=1 Tax=Rhodovibrio salinarum TaxID=1087 RepID=UPI001470EEB1|nr:LuxR C-terminal-related transcriptional regulator [Rhodovibrio salinarum]